VATSLIFIHVVSTLVIAVACISAASAILWYILNRRGLSAENSRAGYLLFACLLCCGLSRIVDLSLFFAPYRALALLDAFLVAASLVCGLAVWPLIPTLARLPSAAELREANERLAAQELARGALVSQLAGANRELEGRVAARTDELLESKRRFEAALRGSSISMSQQNRDLKYTWAYNLPGADDANVIGTSPSEHLPPETSNLLISAKRHVLESGEPIQFEFSLVVDGRTHWYEERVEAMVEQDSIVGVISTAVDVTARKRHEIELTELLRELTHRSKNLLAVVQGIARQTSDSSVSVPDFTTRFSARLQALSLAHELLVNASWRETDIGMLVDGVLGNVAAHRRDHISADGPPVLIAPDQAQSVVIAFHEMASNAVEHGALAVDGGRLKISWTKTWAGDKPLLTFVWRESGRPDALSKQRRGFGFSFVEGLLPRALGGRSIVSLENGALVWTLAFPWPSTAQRQDDMRDARSVAGGQA
jgi:PAS domain S-box-containing protein